MNRNPLHALCPYFAMFPETFAEEQIARHSVEDDLVYDPFSGRGTTVFQALLMNRFAAGGDINPVAYCISSAKANVSPLVTILETIDQLELEFLAADHSSIEASRSALPPFFKRAFYHTTLREILFLRDSLEWKSNRVHCFIAALALGSMHGELNGAASYFSNQMPRTISTKPDYSIRYWKTHNLYPKKRKVFDILRVKARYRLSGDVPRHAGRVELLDVRSTAKRFSDFAGKVRLVLTSPPYLDVTRYEEDQWLRLWFLGNPPHPTYARISKDDRHEKAASYWRFLREAWSGIAPLLRTDAVLVCRLGTRRIALGELTDGFVASIRSVFPGAHLVQAPVLSAIRGRQTDHFRPGSKGCLYEADYTMRLN